MIWSMMKCMKKISWKFNSSLYFIPGSGLCLCFGIAAGAFHIAWMKPANSHTLKSLLFAYVMYHIAVPIFGRYCHREMLKEMKNPQKRQNALLMEILQENGQTSFGRDHGLLNFKSVQDFWSKFKTFQGLKTPCEG